MKKIYCICVGASKCGTTALYSNLRSHPDISLPKDRKEIHFFNKFFNRGVDWYENLFDGDMKIDITPSYFSYKHIAKDIFDYGTKKIIILLRNPFKRIESQYKMYHRSNYKPISFRNYIFSEKVGVKSNNYYYLIQDYIKYFKSEVLFIDSEIFSKDEQYIMDRVFDFLNVKRIKLNSNISKIGKNQSLEPRNIFIYRLIYKIKNFLRNRKLDYFVSFLNKTLKIKEFLFTSRNQKLDLKWDSEMIEYFEKEYFRNIDQIKELGINVNSWIEHLDKLKKDI